MKHYQQIEVLSDLIKVDFDQRNQDWESQFFKLCVTQKYSLLSDSSQMGPDGFSYLLVKHSDQSTDSHQTESFKSLADWCLKTGVGLVINPQKDEPDYIFTLGMLWHFAIHGKFKTDNLHIQDKFVFLPGDQIKKVELTDQLIPGLIQHFMKLFLKQQGVDQPRVLILKQPTHLDFIFSLESLGSPEESEHHDICEALSWFLPTHYPLMILSEVGLPKFDLLNPVPTALN